MGGRREQKKGWEWELWLGRKTNKKIKLNKINILDKKNKESIILPYFFLLVFPGTKKMNTSETILFFLKLLEKSALWRIHSQPTEILYVIRFRSD